MAIRIGTSPVLARWVLHWQAAHNYYLRRSSVISHVKRDCAEGLRRANSWRHRGIERLRYCCSPGYRTLVRRKKLTASFYERYEMLVDLLCWAAHEGELAAAKSSERDARYIYVRQWMQLNYHKLRPLLRPYLGVWYGPLDPFEELFAPESIEDLLNDYDAIPNVVQTRQALEAYRTATGEN